MISYRYIFLFGKVLFGKLIALCRRFGLVLWGFSKLLLLLSVVWLLVAIVITPTWAPKKLKTLIQWCVERSRVLFMSSLGSM